MIGRFPLSELPPGSLRRLTHPPYDVVVANVGGRLFAVEDACPHSGASLSRGRIEGGCVVCRAHGWAVDLETGEVRTEAGKGQASPVFDVQVQDGDVVVRARKPSGSVG